MDWVPIVSHTSIQLLCKTCGEVLRRRYFEPANDEARWNHLGRMRASQPRRKAVWVCGCPLLQSKKAADQISFLGSKVRGFTDQQSMSVVFRDDITQEARFGVIQAGGYGFDLRVDGYGNFTSDPGEGAILFIEIHEGKLRLHTWEDITQEDLTTTIEFEGAKEEHRVN